MRIHRCILVPSIALLSWIAVFLTSLAQENLPAIVKKIEPSVVVILTYDKEGKTIGQGSGFFISENGDVITNRHVLEGATTATVKTADGKVYTITMVLAEDKEGDLIRVLADIPPNVVHPLTLSTSLPKVGERVVVIGSPLGLEQSVSDGIVSAVREIPEFGNILQITAPISQGSSGSPVVNMKGEVIGVATLQIIEGQNLNFAILGERITRLVPGKGKTLAEWAEGRAKKWLASAEGIFNTGLSFYLMEDYEKAISYFQEAVKKNPSYAEAYYKLGVASAELGRYQEAKEAFKEAIRAKPDYAEAHYNMGVVYVELGRYQEAKEAFKEAIRIKPDFADAHCNLGLAYAVIGCYKEAIEACKEAIRIKPDFADAHFALGLAYSRLKRYTDAIEAYKQAIRIKPDLDRWHFSLGEAYLWIGDRGSAMEEYKILKDLNKDLANELFNLIYK